jgi:hypothetical protein
MVLSVICRTLQVVNLERADASLKAATDAAHLENITTFVRISPQELYATIMKYVLAVFVLITSA